MWGHPIAHSLSPILHNAAYQALGLVGWEYGRDDVIETDLPDRIGVLDPTWAGLSLTMPLKQAVIPLLDDVDPVATATGAVNTVVVHPEGRLVGYNTDVAGIVAALQEAGFAAGDGAELSGGTSTPNYAVVLGAGATAASAVAALAELGFNSPCIKVRSLARTTSLREAAARIGVTPEFQLLDSLTCAETLSRAQAVVSTLPAHVADAIADRLRSTKIAPRGVLLDVVYHPRPTALVEAWRDLGGRAVTGERMLLHQAAEQVTLMTGLAAPVEAMDQALQAALAN